MTEPSAPRSLGNYKQLLEPFDHSFEQGLAEIPDNIERSRKTITRIKKASEKGKEDINGFLKQRTGETKEVRKQFRRQKWALRFAKLEYWWAQLGRGAVYGLLRLRLFWHHYKLVLIALFAFCVLLYGVMVYSHDVIGFLQALMASLFDEAGGQAVFLGDEQIAVLVGFRGGLG